MRSDRCLLAGLRPNYVRRASVRTAATGYVLYTMPTSDDRLHAGNATHESPSPPRNVQFIVTKA